MQLKLKPPDTHFPRRSGSESLGSIYEPGVQDMKMLCDAGSGSKERTPGRTLGWEFRVEKEDILQMNSYFA